MRKSSIAQVVSIAASVVLLCGCNGGRTDVCMSGDVSACADSMLLSMQGGADTSLTIMFTGDVLLDRGVRAVIERQGIDYIFADVATLFAQADAVVINIECPLTDSHSPLGKQFIFRAEPSWAEGLRRAGITHAAMANNHTNDQGRTGISDTYRHLVAAGITPLGYGENHEQRHEPVVVEQGDVKVALFNAAMMTMESWHRRPDRPDIWQPADDELVGVVESYIEANPSTKIICVLHWGVEFQSMPSRQQRILAHRLSRAGVDVIVGHHPHVLQPVEVIDDRTIVYYSLGNFVFDQHPPLTRHSMIACLTLSADSGVIHTETAIEISGCVPKQMQGN